MSFPLPLPLAGAPTTGFGVPAPLLDRLAARALDGLVLALPYAAVTLALTLAVDDVFVRAALLGVVLVALQLGYFGYLESAHGQTIGKSVMRLRTVGPAGASPTLAQAVRRNSFYAAGLLYVAPFVGLFFATLLGFVASVTIAVGINADADTRQSWHDRIAGGTQVLKYR